MNNKSIAFYLGIFSLFVSFFSILNVLYSVYLNFILDVNSYLITFIISLFLGLSLFFWGKNHSKNISLSDQIIFILLSFIIIPALISLPYFLSIYNFSFLNSYFEAVSGLTTTGFSIIKNIHNIDEPLLLWRSSSQWLGGLLFLIAVIGTIGSKQIRIKPAYLISGGASGRNFYNNFNNNFVKIFLIYFFTTIFSIFLLTLTDIRLFDSVNLAFTTVSSGGFIPATNLSDIIVNNLQKFILSIILLYPIFNFFLFFDIITRKFKLKNNQEDFHLLILIILLTLSFYFFITPNHSASSVFLSIVSSISTSGISTYSSDFDISVFFIVLTIIGGSLISTSSGFKYVRFYILLKTSYQEIYRLVKPINVVNKNLFNSESKIVEEDIKIAFLVFILFIISLFVLSSILSFDILNFESTFKLSMLTITNTTTSSLYGLENLSFVDLTSLSKVSLMIFMILGKVEIIAVIYLIKRLIFRE